MFKSDFSVYWHNMQNVFFLADNNVYINSLPCIQNTVLDIQRAQTIARNTAGQSRRRNLPCVLVIKSETISALRQGYPTSYFTLLCHYAVFEKKTNLLVQRFVKTNIFLKSFYLLYSQLGIPVQWNMVVLVTLLSSHRS